MHQIYETLYADQKDVVHKLHEFLKQPPACEQYFKISARAGFGKSYLMSALPYIFPQYTYIFVAPTDAAVAVLRDMLDEKDLHRIETRTAHSLFRIGIDYSEEGQSFNYYSAGQVSEALESPQNTVVVFDECSMASSIFLEATQYIPAKYIFVGDPKQLPPVKGAPLFDTAPIEDRWSTSLTLGKRAKNPEVQASIDRIADFGFDGIDPAQRIPTSKAAIMICQQIEEGKSTRFVSYRHKVVNTMADSIRYELKGLLPDNDFIEGERVRLSSVTIDNVKVVKNNAIMTVVSADTFMLCGYIDGIFHALPRIDLVKKEELFLAAKTTKEKKKWRAYYTYTQGCAVTSSPYASTVHSAQGITVDFIYFDLQDLLRFNCPKILYTAASRSKEFYKYF